MNVTTNISKEKTIHGFSSESFLDTVEAGKYLNLSPATLEKYRQKKSRIKGPKFLRFGNHKIFYNVHDLQDWLNSRLTECDNSK